MSEPSPLTLALSAASSATAVSMAASSACLSSLGLPLLGRPATSAVTMTTGPIVIPPDAARPFSSRVCCIRMILIEIVFDKCDEGLEGRVRIRPVGPEIQGRVLASPSSP